MLYLAHQYLDDGINRIEMPRGVNHKSSVTVAWEIFNESLINLVLLTNSTSLSLMLDR